VTGRAKPRWFTRNVTKIILQDEIGKRDLAGGDADEVDVIEPVTQRVVAVASAVVMTAQDRLRRDGIGFNRVAALDSWA